MDPYVPERSGYAAAPGGKFGLIPRVSWEVQSILRPVGYAVAPGRKFGLILRVSEDVQEILRLVRTGVYH